ncbi:hypothetical protein PBY51_023893 [Eleginops maclovinus]|uniref:Uncharacterized protein n=1 Tax=Eleginops maclovinus TaxID=56733 RepID=A0AAN7X342_ELEMC|nr:hypothetical protein PBY51_023893 [Eleginops maclovinus]
MQLQCDGVPSDHRGLLGALLGGSAGEDAVYLHCSGEEDPRPRSQFFHVEIHGAALSRAYRRQGVCVSVADLRIS